MFQFHGLAPPVNEKAACTTNQPKTYQLWRLTRTWERWDVGRRRWKTVKITSHPLLCLSPAFPIVWRDSHSDGLHISTPFTCSLLFSVSHSSPCRAAERMMIWLSCHGQLRLWFHDRDRNMNCKHVIHQEQVKLSQMFHWFAVRCFDTKGFQFLMEYWRWSSYSFIPSLSV